MGIIATNRKAFHEYNILERFEAGLVLTGFEVKSLRLRGANISDAFVRITPDMEAVLLNANITGFQGGVKSHEERRTRKLLLHAREIKSIYGQLSQGGFALVPLKLYTKHNVIKVEIGLGKHKKQYEKRDVLRQKAIKRDVERTLRGDKE